MAILHGHHTRIDNGAEMTRKSGTGSITRDGYIRHKRIVAEKKAQKKLDVIMSEEKSTE